MKETTLFDFLPDCFLRKEESMQISKPNLGFKKKKKSLVDTQKKLEKLYVQKNLFQIINEEEELKEIIKNLGSDWNKQKDGFGYIDKENIMIFSTVTDFNANFFKIYKFKDFKLIVKEINENSEISEDKNKFIKINNCKYNSYYLFITLKILDVNYKIYQHKNLKLLFLRNENYASLICPRF